MTLVFLYKTHSDDGVWIGLLNAIICVNTTNETENTERFPFLKLNAAQQLLLITLYSPPPGPASGRTKHAAEAGIEKGQPVVAHVCQRCRRAICGVFPCDV